MSYKRLIPCLFLEGNKAVKWFNDKEILADDAVSLAKHYSDRGADELIIFDLSETSKDHESALEILKQIRQVIHMPMTAGHRLKSLDEIERILDAGAKRAIISFSNDDAVNLIRQAAEKFGKQRVAVSLNDFDSLFKKQHIIKEFSTEMIFLHRLDLNSVTSITEIPCVIVTDAMEADELVNILKSPVVKGLSGKFISQVDIDYRDLKNRCVENGVQMTSFESNIDFSEFKLDDNGLIPVIVQHYKTQEVLMLAYMNAEAFESTLRSGRMTYYSRSRKKLWLKGETSGHYQFVKSLTIDCDKDTILAKVDQVGAACHTGNPTCFFQSLAGSEIDTEDTTGVLDRIYIKIQNSMPDDIPHTNDLFDKNLDKVLMQFGNTTTELLINSKTSNGVETKERIANVICNMISLMIEKGLSLEEVKAELAKHLEQ